MSKENTIHRIESCKFQREKDGPIERGILLNEGRLGIIDANGKHVGPESSVWTWNKASEFAFETTFFENK